MTFNCHEPYVHLLGKLGHEMDVVDGLSGRHAMRWAPSCWNKATWSKPPKSIAPIWVWMIR